MFNWESLHPPKVHCKIDISRKMAADAIILYSFILICMHQFSLHYRRTSKIQITWEREVNTMVHICITRNAKQKKNESAGKNVENYIYNNKYISLYMTPSFSRSVLYFSRRMEKDIKRRRSHLYASF